MQSTFKHRPSYALLTGLLGITLLLPASFFMLTLLARILFGTKALYYYIAPSFLQSPWALFALHKAQLIVLCLVLAILLNAWVLLRFRLTRGPGVPQVQVTFRSNWLNMAIALQAMLLLGVLIAYTCIQHIRY